MTTTETIETTIKTTGAVEMPANPNHYTHIRMDLIQRIGGLYRTIICRMSVCVDGRWHDVRSPAGIGGEVMISDNMTADQQAAQHAKFDALKIDAIAKFDAAAAKMPRK